MLHLYLENNRFDSEVGDELVKALGVNKNLLSLGVSDVEIGCDAAGIVETEMQARQPGRSFELGDHDDA